jgi:RNA polymerase sigma factor (sigma-70 family)
MDASDPPLPKAPPDQGAASATALSSFELVIRANTGDRTALEALFARYAARLQRWAHGRLPPGVRGSLQTMDLVQDTLVSVFQHLPTFSPRHEGAFQGYVRTILRNRLNDVLRQYQRRGPAAELDPEAPGNGDSPYDLTAFTETLSHYDAALDRLRPDDKEMVIARVELCMSYAEITERFEKPSVSATRMAVSRALVRLAEEMARGRQV